MITALPIKIFGAHVQSVHSAPRLSAPCITPCPHFISSRLCLPKQVQSRLISRRMWSFS